MEMDDEETRNFVSAGRAFMQYGRNAHRDLVEFKEQRVASLPPDQRRLASALVLPHVSRVSACISHNASVAKVMASGLGDLVASAPSVDQLADDSEEENWDQIRIAFSQLAREWSSDGRTERRQSFDPVIDVLMREFPDPSGKRVLVPGCGLGRLPFELAKRGFIADGNEFSCTMLLAQHAVLHMSPSARCWTVYPYVHALSHYASGVDQTHSIEIPDVSPTEGELAGEMSMLCGLFDTSFDTCPTGHYDAIATVFFLDTATNIFETLSVISRIVKPGGLWINFGPLHWHFEKVVASSTAQSGGLELTLNGLISLVEMHDWEFETRRSRVPSTYGATNPKRMSPYVYDCEFWVARRVIHRQST